MQNYTPTNIEPKWQKYWEETNVYQTEIDPSKPKYYILDMFPYPSGAGLHVGHPLGYIASDIVARYKRMKGFNVLHPMGFDAFGLPAEQYAIQTGQHPAITTEQNLTRYKEQLGKIGFSFDWSREVKTCDPAYYKWTQWIFKQLFNHYYCYQANKALPIEQLEQRLAKNGTQGLQAACDANTPTLTATDWAQKTDQQKARYLLHYRLAYLSETAVNWCPALGTVLANEEVKDGYSERGGHPVERKNMQQWSLRITAYAERLLEGLNRIDWPEPIKEMQRNWIGRSEGAEVDFEIINHPTEKLKVFTTRPDTIFGVTFMVIAPEHELVAQITTPDQKTAIEAYIAQTKARSERDRMADTKTVSGCFTGAYVKHPFKNQQIPIYIADYVLMGYGTGAIMAVPSSDMRDYNFAKHFNIEIIDIQTGKHTDITQDNFDPRAGTMVNSDFLNQLPVNQAIPKAIAAIETQNIGTKKINYRIRDAVFSRQRYWGEPFPIYFTPDGLPHTLPNNQLPLTLPEVDAYLPTETGEPPLARATNWQYNNQHPYEHSTMPGWAGSSWYFLRYMDPTNNNEPFGKQAVDYWQDVDLYIGGSEHATGHLLYSRFWMKFLFDLGLVNKDEYAKKLVNQGMIQGRSAYAYRRKGTNQFVSVNQINPTECIPMHVDVSLIDANDNLDTVAFKKWRKDLSDATFKTEPDGRFICERVVEKMSKSMYNVVNPDDVVQQYGADTLRLYEMFLGPIEQSKPWNTAGIEGVSKFLRKLWRLFYDNNGNLKISNEKPTDKELKTLHKFIKKATEDIENLSFNTSVSAGMVCVNELTDLKCNKKAVLEPLICTLAPFAPHLAEELWHNLGNTITVTKADFPVFNEAYLKESAFEYPVMINGKLRAKLTLPLDLKPDQMIDELLKSGVAEKWLENKTIRKKIAIPGKIINIVV